MRAIHELKIKPDFLTQQIHCSIGTFSFPRETSHEKFIKLNEFKFHKILRSTVS